MQDFNQELLRKIYYANGSSRPNWRVKCSLLFLILSLALAFSESVQAQCNPSGNSSRFEYAITPAATFNLAGQELCTDPALGNGCCSMQSGFRCIDLIFNINTLPGGAPFTPSCSGKLLLTAGQGVFDSLYFGVGAPNPVGNNTNCSAPVALGSNYEIELEYAGNSSNQLIVSLSVKNDMGVSVFNETQLASPGQSVILTVCENGLGCLLQDFVFGCCSATASLDIAAPANDSICVGGNSILKFTASNGLPPYTATVRALSSVDTTILSFIVNDDNDGNPASDTAIFPVSPSISTTYRLLSIEDAGGCVQPAEDDVVITVLPNPTCSVTGLDTVCLNTLAPSLYEAPAGAFTFGWTISGDAVIAGDADQQVVLVDAVNTGAFTLTLTLEDDFGCTASCSKQVVVVDPVLTLTASSPQTMTICGDTVTVTIVASTDVQDIFTLQYGIGWNPGELDYIDHTALSLLGVPPTINVTSGEFWYSWVDLVNDGTALNGLTLVTLRFRAASGSSTASVHIVEFLPALDFEVIADPVQFCSVNLIPQNNVAVGLSLFEVTCPASQTVCSDQPAFTLTDGNPTGGTHSGPGVTGNVFSPDAAGPGAHVITYTVTNVNNCSATCTYTITVDEAAGVEAGADQAICQNQTVLLNAQLLGSATSGSWSGGAGQFSDPLSPVTVYTPAPTEYGSAVVLTFTTNDPAGICTADSDNLQITINTLPIVQAGPDRSACAADGLNLTLQGASIQPNGSGVSTGFWSTSGTGTFQPNNTFPGAQKYVPSQADKNAGLVTLTLTSADPAGPCSPVFDAMILRFEGSGGIVCNDLVTIALGQTGMYQIVPDDVLEGTYNYDLFSVNILKNGISIGDKVNCSHLNTPLKVVATNICNGNSCITNVQVVDNLAPVAVCTDFTLPCIVANFDPTYLFVNLNLTQAFPTTTDNCTVAALSHTDVWVTLPCNGAFNGQTDLTGYIQRTWTVVDQGGLKDTCIQYIYLKRNHIEDVFMPSDTVMSCEIANTAPAVTGTPFVQALDRNWPLWPDQGYCDLQLEYEDQVLSGCGATQSVLRRWTIFDPCRPTSSAPSNPNPFYYVQSIVIVDTIAPVFQCPAALTVNTNPNDCLGTVNLPDVIVEDACSAIESIRAEYLQDGITKIVNGTLTTFPGNNVNDPDTLGGLGVVGNLPLGTTVFQYFINDLCDNIATCLVEVTVEDQTLPVAVCDEFTQVALTMNGMAFVNAFTFDDGSYDNCSPLIYKVRRVADNSCQDTAFFYDQVKFCCEDVPDTVQVVLRVYDVPVPIGPVSLDFEEEHANDCLVQVLVEDRIRPVCTPPSNVTVSCENFDPSLWTYGFAQGADNCCVDTVTVSTNLTLFDTICNRGTIQRTFRVSDCGGQTSQCNQRIVVEYEQDYFIRFPDDVILTACDGTDNYGEPQIFGEDCELLAISRQDEVFTAVPDACFKIVRTWHVINWCTYDPNLPITQVPNPNPSAVVNHASNLAGPVVSQSGTTAPWAPTVAKLTPNDPQPTNFSQFWSPDNNGYTYKQVIKVIDNVPPIIGACPSNPKYCDLSENNAQLWNAPYWFDPNLGLQDLCEGEANLAISATDLCSGSNLTVRYLLFLDTDYDDVMETVVSSTNLPGFNRINYGNANTPNFSGGTPREFDHRPVSSNQKFGFALQTTFIGNQLAAFVRWNTASAPNNFASPQLPHGRHKIKWFISDGCGNETVCEYNFVVEDCKAPTIVCKNGLSVNITPTGTLNLYAADFLLHTQDNCTPANQLQLGLVRSDLSNGAFPLDGAGQPQISVTYDCTDLGQQPVQLWSRDQQGNADFCETYVIVQDNQNNCSNSSVTVAGALKTEQQAGLEGAGIELSATHPVLPALNIFSDSDPQGLYAFSNALPLASAYTVTPWKDDLHANGVSTYDLVLISKHILGLEPLSSPYKMIAADANKSNSITTFDIVELRKLILGVYDELPNMPSWRFVDSDYQFADSTNPFAMPFPESKSELDVQGAMTDNNFVAVKIGDVNGSAIANVLDAGSDRSAGVLTFDLYTMEGAQANVPTLNQTALCGPDLEAGKTYTLLFQTPEAAEAFQFTLNHQDVEILEILPGADMALEHFAQFADAITCSFNRLSGAAGGKQNFAIVIQALRSAPVHAMVSLSNRITKSEAYVRANGMEKWEISLRYHSPAGVTVSGVGFELYQNTPNPFVSKTTVGFHLPEKTEARIEIFDEAGRLLHTQKGVFEKGVNCFVLEARTIQASGMLYYKVSTEQHSASLQMLKVN